MLGRVTVLVSALFAATAAHASVQYRVDGDAVALLGGPTRAGARITIPRIPLVDGRPESIVVERFEVWNRDAEIKVYGPNDEVLDSKAPPAVSYYRGHVAGRPDSVVFLAVTGRSIDGLIYAAERKFAVGSLRARSGRLHLLVQESSVLDDFPAEGTFTCEVDNQTISPTALRPRALESNLQIAPNAAPTGTQRSLIHLAVETDYELFLNAADGPNANTEDDVIAFIGNLVGAVSTIYERDLTTEVRLAYLGIHSSSSDPFTINPGSSGTWNGSTVTWTTSHAMYEFGDRWHNSPPSAVTRSATALISGKTQTAGVAWVNTLCDADITCGASNCGSADANGHYGGRYSYNGGINPPASLAVPDPDANPGYTVPSSNYWPLLQLSHELGHNVGSSHTHCISLTAQEKIDYAVTRNFVDECVSSGGSCYSGGTSVPAEKGSIMSYCHLSGGSNSRFTFGQPNETSWKARSLMIGYMATITPSLSAITAPASLTSGASGTASVTNAGLTYSWTITNGTFTGGGTTATGASVTFSGTADPVTLTVTGSTATGCAISDSKTVTINTVVYSPPTNVVATAASPTSVSVSWSAVAGATNYRVHRAESQGSYLVEFDAGNTTTYTDTTAVAGKSYQYVVRAGASPSYSVFSDDDVATTVIFTDGSLSGVTVKAVHFTELLTAVNAMRTLTGYGPIAFTAPAPGNGVVVAKAHIDDLRGGLTPALGALGLNSTFGETISAASTTVQASHMTELRGKVQ